MAVQITYRVTSDVKWSELDNTEIGANDVSIAKKTHTSGVESRLEDDYNKLVRLTFADSAALLDWRADYSGDASNYTKSGFTLNMNPTYEWSD